MNEILRGYGGAQQKSKKSRGSKIGKQGGQQTGLSLGGDILSENVDDDGEGDGEGDFAGQGEGGDGMDIDGEPIDTEMQEFEQFANGLRKAGGGTN